MALVVEDGTGLANANGYISVSDADAYHADRGRDDWSDATTAQKEAAIVKATDFIDNFYTFPGRRASATQALQWPRDYVCDEFGNEIGDDEVPTAVAHACAEYARIALSVDIVAEPDGELTGSVKRKFEKVGPLEEETEYAGGATNTLRRYPVADMLLRKLTVSANTLLRT